MDILCLKRGVESRYPPSLDQRFLRVSYFIIHNHYSALNTTVPITKYDAIPTTALALMKKENAYLSLEDV